ncbi:hypothetical protein H6771_02980 [Candidatus Peribacteria bacterium]|nr:hypothetical protein [Candidatus Peribacteria bacterium]
MTTDQTIIDSIQQLCLRQGVSKADIGRLLEGRLGKETDSYMTYYKRGEMFLAGKGAVKVGDLQRIAEHFGVTMEYFLGSKEAAKGSKPEQQLAEILSTMGLSASERTVVLKQIEALRG